MSRPSLELRRLGQSFLLFLMLMGFFVPAFAMYLHTSHKIRSDRARFSAVQMASRFDLLLKSRVGMLGVLSSVVPESGLHNHAQFTAWTERVERHVEGFDALSWIAKDATTVWVVPAAPSQDSVTQPWLDPREVATYLKAARDTGLPQLSHLVALSDGGQALALVYPVAGKDEHFQGWLCGVIGVDRLIGKAFTGEVGNSLYVRLKFPEVPGNYFQLGPSGGDPLGAEETTTDLTVLNQHMQISARYMEPVAQAKDMIILRLLIVAGAVGASLVLSLLAYKNLGSRRRLTERLEKEHFQNVLLNLLVHDILNPLLIVRINAEKAAQSASAEGQGHMMKVIFALGQISDVITRVKDVRAIELGRMHLEGEAVPVNEIIAATALLFEQRCRDKGIEADFRACPENPPILVDRVIFQNNVVNNLVANAIKFSEPGGLVTVHAIKRERDVVLEVVDRGIGMSEDIRTHLFLEHIDVSKPGTLGEVGSGIGMLQVRSYTRLFGGSVSVRSRQKGEGGETGTTVSLVLPRA